ncbi:MAG: hypothetical protein EZS28_014618 [Streblomastix strix]|uniref:Uncharacterized protein n=1 Tax=Streblomastix strix TaxID=222440 RepID=A0A5J4W4N5_9EUKA|nr:MAG: hypothetical protein EZS28_014618 [Streblomastix strix]
MIRENEDIGYILNTILEEEPKQFHQHLGEQKRTLRMLTNEHEHGDHSVAHHLDGHHSHGHHSVTHHLDGHHSGHHCITSHHLGDYSVQSHLGSPFHSLSYSDSFEIPYVNDYPTYVCAYDLSSHPELLMATYPLKPNTQLNKSVVKPYKTVSDLDQSLMYLQDESFAQSMDVLKFTDSLYASFLCKEEFIHRSELHIAYSFFLQDFRPAMLMKLLAQLQKAYEYLPGWISR